MHDRPYILVYDLIPSEAIWRLASKWAKMMGCNILRVCGDSSLRLIDGVKQFPTYGPAEFIGLFKNAQGVITNSFHGTVFSILYERPFYCVVPAHMKDAGRMGSLLMSLGLDSQLVKDVDVDHARIDAEIDFQPPKNRLADLRQKSIDFLISALV